MEIENYPLAINLLVAFTCLSPLLLIIYLYKSLPPKYYGLLLWGVILILWASFNFGWLSEAIFKIETSTVNDDSEKSLKYIVLTNLQVWVYVVPAVTAAVGANLITEFLLRNKPSKKA